MTTIVQLETEHIVKQRRVMIAKQVYNSYACPSFVFTISHFSFNREGL